MEHPLKIETDDDWEDLLELCIELQVAANTLVQQIPFVSSSIQRSKDRMNELSAVAESMNG